MKRSSSQSWNLAHGVRLTQAFKAYLRRFGKAHGTLFSGDAASLPKMAKFKTWAIAATEQSSTPLFLRDAVVFLCHQGYAFTFFHSSSAPDAPIYIYVEGEAEPQPVADLWFGYGSEAIGQEEQADGFDQTG